MAELGATWTGAAAPLYGATNALSFLLAASAVALYVLLNSKSENDDDDSSPGGGLMQPVA